MANTSAAWQHLRRLLAARRTGCDLALPTDGEWPAIAALAQANGLGPLLYDAVRQRKVTIPAEIQEDLQATYYQVAAANAFQLEKLEELVARLASAEIPLVVLKGAALLEPVYGNPALRPMADLDLLVARDHVAEACRVLMAAGYNLQPRPPGHTFAYESWLSGEVALSKPTTAGNHAVDIHWHLSAHQWVHHATRINMDALWQEAQPLSIGHHSALRFCPEDTLLHACLHAGFGHGYAYLLNMIDIDRIVPAYPDLDWDRVLQRATDFQVRVPVYYALLFSCELLDTPVPERVLATLRPSGLRDWSVARMADPMRSVLANQSQISGSRQYLLHLALIDRLPGYLRFARYYLLPGDEWLSLRYGLADRWPIRKARFWHPFRVLATMIAAPISRQKP